MKFSIENFFDKYDQLRSFLRIWSHLLKKSLMENFIFLLCNALRVDHLLGSLKQCVPDGTEVNLMPKKSTKR